MSKISEERNQEFSLRDVLNVLRKNILMIVSIILVCVIFGGVYSKIRKPYYIATEHINYRAQLLYSSSSSTDDTVSNINIMDSLIGTVKDFCKQDVVLLRANYYYKNYANWKLENNVGTDAVSVRKALKEYVKYIEDTQNNNDNYSLLVDTEIKHIRPANITISSTSSDQLEFFFSLSYKDENPLVAEEKVRILSLAYAREIQSSTVDNSSSYFGGIDIILTDLGCYGCDVDMSTTKILVIFTLAGVVLSLLCVYLKVLFDNTVKDKETIEKLTGTNLLAYIKDQEAK